jgi:cell division protein FtsQ
MIKRILFTSMWVILVSGLIVTLGFAEKQESKVTCKEPKIFINADNDNDFITIDDVLDLMRSKGDSITGQPLATVNVHEIEDLLYTNPWVKSANVFLDLDGVLQVDIDVRVPLVRVMNSAGESYFIDTDGKLMLWSPEHTPRVLVASGNIHEAYGTWYHTNIGEMSPADTLSKVTVLDDIFKLAKCVTADAFWNSQVEQVIFNAKGDIELVPQVGDHKIIFGDLTDMQEKFNKLKIFYSEGLNHTNWNQYDTLNLKFKDQVVCTKIKGQ